MEGLSLLDWKLQFGAFAIAAMLIWLLVWHIRYTTRFQAQLFKSLEQLQRETNGVLISTNETLTLNNSALDTLSKQMDRMDRSHNRLLRELLQRPCMLDEKIQEEMRSCAVELDVEQIAKGDSTVHKDLETLQRGENENGR